MGIAIEIKGIEEVNRFLNKTSKKIYEEADKAIKESGFYVEGEVKLSIAGQKAEPRSVDTGRFLNSVKATQNKPLTATISSNVAYAGTLEYGISTRKPRYHFTNSAKRNENKVKEFVQNKIKNIT